MRQTVVGAVLIALAALLILPAAPVATGQQSREIVVGALITRDGGRPIGNEEATLRIAEEDINARLAAQATGVRVRFVMVNTERDPARALAAVQSMAQQGIRLVIGPDTSAELEAIKPFVDSAGMIVISYASTAPGLATPGDNVFRFVPDDTHQADAIVALMTDDQVRTIVPLYRGDVYGDGLLAALRTRFGGTLAEGIRYSPATVDHHAEVAAFAERVEAARATGASVGVYFVAFPEEAPAILEIAATYPSLAGVRWYGSDGIAQQSSVIDDPIAAEFAVKVGLPNPIFGQVGDIAQLEDVSERVRALIGDAPTAYALAAYDAATVGVVALLLAGNGDNIDRFRQVLIETADLYDGLTGPTTLNAAGDRAGGDYDFWAIRSENGGFYWQRVAIYDVHTATSGIIVRREVAGPQPTPPPGPPVPPTLPFPGLQPPVVPVPSATPDSLPGPIVIPGLR
ncbi:MAG: ABC transporter substrate-binding protein [Dehalococcoidia bacterium]